ncbi:MAG: ABC transporter permease subunit [Proteobacteria bacterium]|nr:ABC transporter permease subunit [Pseudomonadota bacterium]
MTPLRPIILIGQHREKGSLLSRIKGLFGRTGVIALPYGWHIIFFLIPFFLVLKISFSQSIIGAPPYAEMVEWIDGTFLQIRLNLENYTFLLEDSLYFEAYLESLRLSGIATLISLCLGYPIAYGIAKASPRMRILLLCLIILPFWTSLLIRIYAWMGLLSPQGLINTVFLSLNITSEPLPLLHNDFAVCLGIVYSYMPFMILPLYVALEKIDPHLLEAAYDLGCKPWKGFVMVTLPLSMRGALAGSMLVFIPGVGEYIIPELLGGPDNIMIGKVLWNEFFINRDWPLASALAMALLVLLVMPIVVFQKLLSIQTDA